MQMLACYIEDLDSLLMNDKGGGKGEFLKNRV